MRMWITRHPVLLTMTLLAAALLATAAVVDHYLRNWLILPLI